MLNQARERGVDNDTIQPLEELIASSRSALDNRDYKTAGEAAIKANTSARESFTFIKEHCKIMHSFHFPPPLTESI